MADSTPVFLPRESHEQYEKAKNMTLETEPPRSKVVQYATGKSRRQLLIAPEIMKWLGQSGNDAHLWMVKVQSDAVKNNIT